MIIGHNQYIAWGITNALTDVQDNYILEEDAQSTGYWLNGTFHLYSIREELIHIKGSDSIPLRVRDTLVGPVMSDIPDVQEYPGKQPIALRWPTLEENDSSLEFIHINLAKNWDEFRAAVSILTGPPVSMTFADVAGNIGYQLVGKTPIRGLSTGIIIILS